MHTLRIEHKISDFGSWRSAFDRDPVGRPTAGVVRHRVLRPVDDTRYVMIDLDFGSQREADAFLDRMHIVWGSRRDAPALVGAPSGRVLAVVDVQDYASQATGPDAHRPRLHGMWAAVAGSWAQHADFADARHAQVTEQMLDLTAPEPGERVLELACGPGGTGLAAARRVVPDGHVVLSDVAAEMTAIAAARADARGIANVSIRELDLERIDEPDCSFDVVLCREGLMFAPDAARAAREIRRVLRPGGRVALTVWGPRERNPWLAIVLDGVSAQLGRPVPPPGVPGPFSLADSAELAGLLSDAGLIDVEVGELSVPLRASSFDEWWTRTAALAGPIASMLASMPAAAADGLRARLRTAVSRHETPDGLELPGATLIAAGRRAPGAGDR